MLLQLDDFRLLALLDVPVAAAPSVSRAIRTLPGLREGHRGSHHAGTAHDRFSFLPGLASDLKGVALLELWQEEFHREGTGVFLVGELFENPREWTDSIAGDDSR